MLSVYNMNKKLLIGLVALTMFVGSASAISIPFLNGGNTAQPTSAQECMEMDSCVLANQTDITIEGVQEAEQDKGIFEMFATLVDWQDSFIGDNMESVDEGDTADLYTEIKVTWDSGSSGDTLWLTEGVSAIYPLVDGKDATNNPELGPSNAQGHSVTYNEFEQIDIEIDTENWYDSYPPSHKGWSVTFWMEGISPEKAGETAFEVLPDQDGDGVIDSNDACPTVAGDEDTDGCPDSDGDGIKDSLDDCPDTEGDEETDGCPDSDGDGVKDSIDSCDNTAGDNTNGCPTVYWNDGGSCVQQNLETVPSTANTYDTELACAENELDNNDDNQSDDDNQNDDNQSDDDNNQTDPNPDDTEKVFGVDQTTFGATALLFAGFMMVVVYFNS